MSLLFCADIHVAPEGFTAACLRWLLEGSSFFYGTFTDGTEMIDVVSTYLVLLAKNWGRFCKIPWMSVHSLAVANEDAYEVNMGTKCAPFDYSQSGIASDHLSVCFCNFKFFPRVCTITCF